MSQNRFGLSSILSNQKRVTRRRVSLSRVSLDRFPFPTATGLEISYMNVITSGATVTTSGNYKIATFNGSGSFQIDKLGTSPTEGSAIEYLIVAGGGGGSVGGGAIAGGGGGAGGFQTATGQSVSIQTYTVAIGGGGASNYCVPPCGLFGGNGSNSGIFSTSPFPAIWSIGGGGGASGNSPAYWNGRSGGSGGGSSGNPSTCVCTTGRGTPGQGNRGGVGRTQSPGATTYYQGGGGGGAGAVGGDGSPTTPNKAGNGGNGLASPITGTPVTYAGGGGGGSSSPSPTSGGCGGAGGGGNGASGPGNAVAGTTNTGGGGGGKGGSASCTGKAGGSGVIIVKWRFQ